ncbi:carbohydrate kinase family protein [Paracoccus siganidrum]|uniref:Carbohydrate kinase n=1 Tax=Paracoccus siganidrum TaxID=1276757 RepID=A0A419A873_9RHOB|nr:carbohydrate kinase [Paracoccus siganidrum]RJL18053.1 carbohydrate kinase [Paracoccus siganidrum]RMC40438.1 carbohydrate kinase [Paracoccus siganidrum]
MILCAGESLIDMVPEAGAFRPLAGGSVYNTAIALGRLGEPVAYLWPISRDGFGDILLRPLAEAGVDTGLCPRSDRLTTLAVVSLRDGEARYSFYDEGSAGRMLAPEDIPALPDHIQAIFAGGISLVPDPCGAAIESLIGRNHAGLPVMLDPNIRPFFITDPAAYRARLDRLLAMSDIVKLSSDDLEWLFPDLAPEEAAQQVLAAGPRIVLQTGGASGARAIWAGGAVTAPAIRTTVADTIGAGDTFNAGVLASLRRQGLLSKAALARISADQLQAALALGAQAAAITVSRPGANPPWAHEMPA